MSAEQQRLKKIHREAVVLAEMKQRLGLPLTTADSSSSAAPAAAAAAATPKSPEEEAVGRDVYDTYGLSMTAVDAYLLRYLRSKNLVVEDAVAKLRRRRIFERTLPMISVTPTTVAALRSGAFHLLDHDLEGRPVLYINVATFTLPTLELDEAQRLLVILLEFMQARCLLKNNEDAAAMQRRRRRHVDATAASSGFANGGRENSRGAATPARAVQDVDKEAVSDLQQFTLLVNEEGAPWMMHASFLKNCSTLLSLLPKYYPLLLGPVLVLGASFEIRTAIKACVGSSSEDVRNSVQMIEKADLPRYMDASTIPVELGGHKQIVGSATNFSEAVLRHWFAFTSQMEDERAGDGGVADSKVPTTISAASAGPASEAGAPNGHKEDAIGAETSHSLPRPLYVPPPPLGTTQRRISRQRHAVELQHLSSSGVSVVGAITGPGSPGPMRPCKYGGSSARNGKHILMSPAAAANRSTAVTTPHDTPTSQKDQAAATVTLGAGRAEDVTDDGVCSALSGADDRDDDAENEGCGAGMHTRTNSGVPTYQLYTAASSLAGSLTVEGEMHLSGLGASHNRHHLGASLYSVASATISREEAAHFADRPDDAVVALRQERRRRQRAEQALYFRDLGVALDMRNASIIEKELAAIHQDLNVLVAEILVKAEAARKRQKAPPTLNQLLDLTLTAFENVTCTPSSVPAMALAEPVQREAVSSSCCSFM
ncbi:CRAL/TRIO domain family protein [Leishmania donovani]|uniref:CRAL/TRIO domain family protein n=1 Tax=Leishmania donovani TaxID=5661 RepID=A0A504Y1X0_LEIDO|nr:CRAL/TRIO domain family protein [Leishmania donovani]